MGNPFSKERHETTDNNKLEIYLKDVFKRECAYKIEKEEVEFIKTGIETIVKKIADEVLDNSTLQESMKVKFEIYFSGKLTRSPMNIFSAGSFYEDTKNNFPDEFDFILSLYNIEGTFEEYKQLLLEASVFNTVAGTFSEKVKEHDKTNLLYTAPCRKLGDARKLYFGKYLHQHGPATWLRFIYENESNRKREIDVDYVAALKITDRSVLNRVVRESCVLTAFAQEVLSDGSCFCIGANFSFTQTEVRIMRHVLSEKHRKIYRILKYLINGHGDVEKLQEKLGNFDKPYSSYMIKTIMIFHHYNFKTSDAGSFGPCILEVMDELCRYKTTSEFPSLFKTGYGTKIRCDLCLLSSLRSLSVCLRSMQRLSRSSYDYEKDKIKKSVSIRYLDTLGK